jgi:hypothetical protein
MNPILNTCITILLLTGFAGCKMTNSGISRLWFYTHNSGEPTGGDTLLTPASFLELRPDGTYTRDFGRFEYGAWTRNQLRLFLTSQSHTTYIFQLGETPGEEMQLKLSKDLVGHFESQPIPSDKESDDPFSVYNNRWRIPATRKESDDEIRKRLYNHCQFWVAYFAWALKRELTTVDVRSTPTLIKIYGNGFTLKPPEDLPAEWKSFFFDEEDCRKANEMMRDLFQHKTIAWANTDNKYKMFLGAFQQMENFLR